MRGKRSKGSPLVLGICFVSDSFGHACKGSPPSGSERPWVLIVEIFQVGSHKVRNCFAFTFEIVVDFLFKGLPNKLLIQKSAYMTREFIWNRWGRCRKSWD